MGFSLEETKDGLRIYSRDKEIGRVCQHADGTWIGVIGKYVMVRGLQTPKQAFNEATSKYLRYDESWKKQRSKPRKAAPQQKPPAHTPIIMHHYVPERFTATRAYMRPRPDGISLSGERQRR